MTTVIEKGKVIHFSYVLNDLDGNEIERSTADSPMKYLHGYRNLMPGLEEALAGRSEQDEVTVTLPPERAYGLRRENAEQRVPIKHLLTKKKKYRPGDAVKINTKDGARDAVVIKAGKFNVDIDFNHPLAGKTVTFAVRIESVRDATSEEVSHGHAH